MSGEVEEAELEGVSGLLIGMEFGVGGDVLNPGGRSGEGDGETTGVESDDGEKDFARRRRTRGPLFRG